MALRVLADTPSLTLTFLRVGHGPDPSQRSDEMTGMPMSGSDHDRLDRQALDAPDDRRAVGRLAERALRGKARVGGRARRVRPVRPSPDAAGRGTCGGRSADEHLAGVQPLRLGRRRLGRHLVRGRSAAGRARPAVPRPGRPAAVLPLRLPVPPLAREDPPRPGRLRRRRPRRIPERGRAAEGIRPRRLPRPQRVHDAARLRPRRAVPRPRRAPRVPLGQQLLLEGREARSVAQARRAVAHAETTRGASPRRPVPGQRRRDAPGAVLHPRRLRRALAVRRHGARGRRHAGRRGRRLRDRDRHHDAALAAGHQGARPDPEPVRARAPRRDVVLRDRCGRQGLLGGRPGLPGGAPPPDRDAPHGQPLAPHARTARRGRRAGAPDRYAGSAAGALLRNATRANGIVARSCPVATSRKT